MIRVRALGLALACLPAAVACTEVNTDPNAVVAISLDSVATPSVVAGDTLRDTLGVAQPLRGTVYNFKGKPIVGYAIKYRAIDVGLHVDSLTGFVVADTALPTAVRVLDDAGGLQSQPVALFVVPRPYQVLAVNAVDSVIYSLTDTTSIASPALTVRVLPQDTLTTTIPIQGYLVSYQIISHLPTDTVWSQLGSVTGRRFKVDTTVASGTSGQAGQAVLIHPLLLPKVTDTLFVNATVKYRGVPLVGSPVQFMLLIKPPA